MKDLQYEGNLLHTPEGVRDIYGKECESKLKIEAGLHKTLKLYGFKDIQTPTFEFFDVFSKERGSVSSKDMYKFFDKENNTLVLRPDITPSIARCVGKYFKDDDVQVRLCYNGNTFINGVSYRGRLKEVTQVGAELLGDGTTDADAEMIALTVECLLTSGLKEFQIDVGHVDFFNGLMEEANLTDDEVVRMKGFMENKNRFGVEELVAEKDLNGDLKELIIRLPELFGGREHVTYAKARTNHVKTKEAIKRLENIHSLMEIYGFEKYLNFDLSMLSQYDYYTGIVFKAYTYGMGDAVATGGRYDALLSQFGRDLKAIGMVIVVDRLMTALNRQKIEIPLGETDTMILYHSDGRRMAIALAGHFRSKGIPTRLVRKSRERDIEDYKTHGRENGFGGILYVEREESVQVIDLKNDTLQTVNPLEMMTEKKR